LHIHFKTSAPKKFHLGITPKAQGSCIFYLEKLKKKAWYVTLKWIIKNRNQVNTTYG
jgi:hypothetical protein